MRFTPKLDGMLRIVILASLVGELTRLILIPCYRRKILKYI